MTNPSNEIPRKTSPETSISPENLATLSSALNSLLEKLPEEDIDGVEGDFEVKSYGTSVELPQTGGFLNISGTTLHHRKHGLLSRVMLFVSHGSRTIGPGMSDGFNFTISDSAVSSAGNVITIDDDTGEIIAGVNEVMTFTDQAAIDKRIKELQEDPNFFPAYQPSSVYMPDFQTTPSGEIYQDGQVMHDHKDFGAIGVSMTFKFKDDQEAAEMQRWEAAYAQARQEVGRGLSDSSALRLADLFTEARSGLSH